MSDMRATERLLEVIAEKAIDIIEDSKAEKFTYGDAELIREAVNELRRRGDTLVRRDDLVLLLMGDGLPGFVSDREHEARQRLENAIGGKPDQPDQRSTYHDKTWYPNPE